MVTIETTVNTDEIVRVYNVLLSNMTSNYAAMWDRNEIDPETYAKLVGQASTQLVQVSSELVQRQELNSLEADIKTRDMIEREATGTKQRLLITAQIAEANKQAALLDIKAEVEDRSISDKELTGIKQRLLIQEQINESKKQQAYLDIKADSEERTTYIKELDSNIQRKLTSAQIGTANAQSAKLEEDVNVSLMQTDKIAEDIRTAKKEQIKIEVDTKLPTLTTQLNLMAQLYKDKQLNNLPEVLTREEEVETLYNSVLDTLGITGGITPGGNTVLDDDNTTI